jgi:light-regulated signal transduction histidine kinase (bacteriophytochrome)
LDAALVAAPDTVFSLAEVAASAIRAITGFDRVMVYRFAEDWHGEVIADARAADMPPYLGLHYPASDIPPQARRLYLDNRIREIGDTLARPVPLVPDCDAAAPRPVDLSTAVLRGISPYHLEYMANMGIRGTLVASVIVDGRLWGLVACHHRAPAVTPWAVRCAVESATERLGAAIAAHRARFDARNADRSARMARRITEALAAPEGRLKAVLDVFATATRSSGVMVVFGREAVALGNAPPAHLLPDLGAALAAEVGAGDGTTPIVSDHLAALWPAAADHADTASGVAALVLSADPPVVIGALRGEHVHEVSWGGDPSRPAERDPATGKLSPRRSFAVWRQAVRGRCRPWDGDIRALLERLADGPALAGLADGLDRQLVDLRAELGHRDALHSAVLNVALDGMLLTAAADAGGVIRLASTNQAFRHLFDMTPEDCESQSLATVLERLGAEPLDGMAPGATREIVAWSPDHGARNMRVHRRNVLDSAIGGDRVMWSIYVLQDVTELRRKEQALVVARDRAIAEAQAKSEFLANMSHELRTPLNAVIGYAELIESAAFGAHASPRYAENAQDIAGAGRHLLTLIDDLLDLSRMDAGRRELQESTFDLADTVAEAIDWVGRDPRSDGVPITLVAPPTGLRVVADRMALSQVAINLVGNAAKFCDAGAPVTVTVDLVQGGCPALVVADRGPGIAPESIDAMFEPFRQGEGVYARRHGGAGLGLAIAKSLVDLHGGTIRMSSTPGEGTEVTVLLPRRRRADSDGTGEAA